MRSLCKLHSGDLSLSCPSHCRPEILGQWSDLSALRHVLLGFMSLSEWEDRSTFKQVPTFSFVSLLHSERRAVPAFQCKYFRLGIQFAVAASAYFSHLTSSSSSFSYDSLLSRRRLAFDGMWNLCVTESERTMQCSTAVVRRVRQLPCSCLGISNHICSLRGYF